MSKLICRDIHIKYFGHDESICGFSADFSDGFNVVFGGSKSGKTTLLKGLSGLIESEGDLFFDDTDVRELSPKDRNFAFVFDDLALFERHSVLYNLEYPLRVRGVAKEERRRRAREAAALFDLDLMTEHYVYKLNDWHRVALALCRAYLRNADVTFIDNVFARLDLCTRKEAFYRFIPLFAHRGIVILATDSVEEASFLSNTVNYLNCGYLLQRGSIAEMREAPSCVVAFETFCDYVSVFPAHLAAEGLSVFDTVIPFDISRLIGENYIGTDVLAGLRPENVTISDSGIPATVRVRFYGENGYLYLLMIGDVELYACDHRVLDPSASIFITVRNVFTLFDPNNERAVVRY